jgi:hypothetical protein
MLQRHRARNVAFDIGGLVSSLTYRSLPVAALLVVATASLASAQARNQAAPQQDNVPQAVQKAEDAIESTVRRFRIGVEAGAGLDPELIVFGAHGAFGPIFHPNVEFRPGLEFGVGEVTTLFALNLDVLYLLPGSTRTTRWMPYVGAGPNFSLSHRGFEADDVDDPRNRFDFSDTDVDAAFNFIAGARNQSGVFFELKATANGPSTIRLVAGFNF